MCVERTTNLLIHLSTGMINSITHHNTQHTTQIQYPRMQKHTQPQTHHHHHHHHHHRIRAITHLQHNTTHTTQIQHPLTCKTAKHTHKHTQGAFACAGFANGEAVVLSLPRPPDGLGPTLSLSSPPAAPFSSALAAAAAAAAAAAGEGGGGGGGNGQKEEAEQPPRIVHRIVGHTGRVREMK
jgi:hypothetical protein